MSNTAPHPFSSPAAPAPPAASPAIGAGAGAARTRPGVSGALTNLRRSMQLLRRLLRGELEVLREVADNPADTRAALLLVALTALAAGLGAWFWMALAADGASVGGGALRLVALGGLAGVAAWALSVGASWWALRRICDVRIEFLRLARPLALAGAVGIAQLALLFVPISFAIGLATVVAWFLMSAAAVRAAAPGLDDRSTYIAVGAGFGVWAIFLSILASAAGVAPGLFVHAAY